MSELEQNKRINQLKRQVTNALERIKSLELDVEPEGRISDGFSAMERHMDEKFDEVDRRLELIESNQNKMRHQLNQLNAKLEIVLESITSINDLPEE